MQSDRFRAAAEAKDFSAIVGSSFTKEDTRFTSS